MRAERLARHQFHRPAECLFQQKRNGHKMIKGFLPRDKIDQEIHVALRVGLVSLKGAKYAETLHTEPTQIAAVAAQASHQVLFGLNCSHSGEKTVMDVATQRNATAIPRHAAGKTHYLIDKTHYHDRRSFGHRVLPSRLRESWSR
jgi:hypothetical protein